MAKIERKSAHSLDRVRVGVAVLFLVTISMMGMPKAQAQRCFGSCGSMPEPIIKQNPARVMQDLEYERRAYDAATAEQAYRRDHPREARVYYGGLAPNELSNAAAVRGEYALEQQKRRDCTILALAPKGSGAAATTARRGLGC